VLFAAATGVGGTLLYFSAARSPDLNPRDGAGELAFYAARPDTRIGVSVSVNDAQHPEPRVEAAIVGPVGARWLLVVSGVWTPVGGTATRSTPPTLVLHPQLGVFTPRSFPIGGEAFSGAIPRPARDVPRSLLPLPVIAARLLLLCLLLRFAASGGGQAWRRLQNAAASWKEKAGYHPRAVGRAVGGSMDAARRTRSIRRPDEVERPLGPVPGYVALAHVDRVEGADQHVDGDVRIGRWRELSGSYASL